MRFLYLFDQAGLQVTPEHGLVMHFVEQGRTTTYAVRGMLLSAQLYVHATVLHELHVMLLAKYRQICCAGAALSGCKHGRCAEE